MYFQRYKYKLFKKAGGRLALSLYVFLHTACFHFELLELAHVRFFPRKKTNVYLLRGLF